MTLCTDYQRFLNLYGERGARLNSTQSIHYSPYRRQNVIDARPRKASSKSWYKRVYSFLFGRPPSHTDSELVTEDADPPIDRVAEKMYQESFRMGFFTVLMFGTPGMHIQKLREMTVDQIVCKQTLIKYSQTMVEEWRDVALYVSTAASTLMLFSPYLPQGTVMLSADISFLSIGSVDEAGTNGRSTGPRIAIYFSLLTSLASVILCLLLLRQHREAMSVRNCGTFPNATGTNRSLFLRLRLLQTEVPLGGVWNPSR